MISSMCRRSLPRVRQNHVCGRSANCKFAWVPLWRRQYFSISTRCTRRTSRVLRCGHELMRATPEVFLLRRKPTTHEINRATGTRRCSPENGQDLIQRAFIKKFKIFNEFCKHLSLVEVSLASIAAETSFFQILKQRVLSRPRYLVRRPVEAQVHDQIVTELKH